MGYLVAAGWLPYLLFALPAGALVDRRGARRLTMIAADIGRAGVLVTLPAAYFAGVLTLYHLYVAVFVIGCLGVLFNVSAATLFISMLPRERYLEGSSLSNGSRALASLGGPALGGLLVQIFSGPAALVADSVSFAVSAVALSLIKPAEPAPQADGPGRLLAGVRFIRRSPIMRACLAATATVNLFTIAYSALGIVFLVQILHLSPGLIGAVLGAGSIGALLGSIAAAPVSRRIGVGPSFMAGCILFPAPLVLVPLASGPLPIILAMLLAAQFGSGAGVLILDVNVNSIFAAHIPDTVRSRVMGAYQVVNYGVRPLGALIGGGLGTAFGLRTGLLVAAAGGLVGFLFLVRSPIPRLRGLPPAGELG